MNCFGQITLEFLVLSAAFLSAFALFVPSIVSIYDSGLFGIDSVNAKNFLNSFSNSVERLSLFGEDSSTKLFSPILNKWIFFYDKNTLFLTVKSNTAKKEKTFSALLLEEISFPKNSFEKEITIFLKKENGKIKIK